MQRRRFLQIAATAAGLSLCPSRLLGHHLQPVRWQGYAMGAVGRFTLYSEQPASTRALLKECFAEIQRLERIFSLYDSNSELCRLNKNGRLDQASPEFIELLTAVDHAHRLTNGGFDPTVQPLYQLYSEHFAQNPHASHGPDEQAISRALNQSGWSKVDFDQSSIHFKQAGMSLTLNGIAQGYITDRISQQLKAAEFENVLVELGETRALGQHPEKQRPWQIGIETTDRQSIDQVISLNNQALATSGSYGSRFSEDGVYHHLINPKTGTPGNNWQRISVIAPTATEADALSTGLSFADRRLLDQILGERSDLQIIQS